MYLYQISQFLQIAFRTEYGGNAFMVIHHLDLTLLCLQLKLWIEWLYALYSSLRSFWSHSDFKIRGFLFSILLGGVIHVSHCVGTFAVESAWFKVFVLTGRAESSWVVCETVLRSFITIFTDTHGADFTILVVLRNVVFQDLSSEMLLRCCIYLLVSKLIFLKSTKFSTLILWCL